jgi:hypothetical protein
MEARDELCSYIQSNLKDNQVELILRFVRSLARFDFLPPLTVVETIETTIPPQQKREYIAYHEAGHAVAAVLLRIPFSYVSIDGPPGTPGQIEFPDESSTFSVDDNGVATDKQVRQRQEERIIATLTARATMERLLDAGHPEIDKGSRSDYRSARGRAESIAGNSYHDQAAYCVWLECRAIHTVRLERHWAAIEAVAANLLKKGRLSAKKTREIIKQAQENWLQKQLNTIEGYDYRAINLDE